MIGVLECGRREQLVRGRFSRIHRAGRADTACAFGQAIGDFVVQQITDGFDIVYKVIWGFRFRYGCPIPVVDLDVQQI